jgi:hypothetical protein
MGAQEGQMTLDESRLLWHDCQWHISRQQLAGPTPRLQSLPTLRRGECEQFLLQSLPLDRTESCQSLRHIATTRHHQDQQRIVVLGEIVRCEHGGIE